MKALCLLLTALFLFDGGRAMVKGGQPKPNIVFVLIDDMGWSDLACYGGPTPTPAIDRMAKEGIRFTNFYVNAPICSPSRTALTTGQYPQRWRITSFLEYRKVNIERGMAQWLDVKCPTLARELHAAGYATGHFGKWHMGGQRDVGEAPLITEYGFDRSLTNFEGLGPRVLPILDAHDGSPVRNYDLGSSKLGHGPIRWEDRSGITTAYVKEALAFVDASQAAGKPFYINLWPDDVHSPFFPPADLRKASGSGKRARYYEVTTAMDRQLAALFERIRGDAKLRDNTLIVIASDNGPEPGAGSADPLRGNKGSLYEGGIREPLIVWGPGFIPAAKNGTTNKTSALCSLDLNRSLYTFSGTPLPKGVTLDGEDFADTLIGKAERPRKGPIFWRRPPDRPGTPEDPAPDLAVRDKQWKCVTDYKGTKTQLFDLIADQSETTNVADKHADIAEGLSKAMLSWNAKLPVDAGDPAFKPEGK